MANPMRLQAIDGILPGQSFTFSRTFTQQDTEAFGAVTRDYNPIHYDARWTDAKGFDGLICHGLLVGSMICELGGQVGWLATGMTFKFIKPVYFGDTVVCTLTITRIEESGRAEARASFVNQDRALVCTATLTGRLPLDAERDILRRMVAEGDPTNGLS